MSVTVSAKLNPVRRSVDPTVVRLADVGDLDAILRLCRQLARENALFAMNEEKVRAGIELAVHKNGGVLGVIGNVGEIEGMMMLRVGQFWYTDQFHLEELFSFVPPKYRRSENAKKLVEWGKKMADDLGIPFFVGITSTIRTEAKVRLYRRMLGTWLGCYFVYGKSKSGQSDEGGPTEH
jgi:hypothetical protein